MLARDPDAGLRAMVFQHERVMLQQDALLLGKGGFLGADAVHQMRAMNREEDMQLLYFGGVRSGTDSAKLLGLGANTVILGTSFAFALGGHVEEGKRFAFYADLSPDERKDRAGAFIKALGAEASIMARCTGKTDVHNLEPEDLRAISIVTAKAAGVPLAGTHHHLAAE